MVEYSHGKWKTSIREEYIEKALQLRLVLLYHYNECREEEYSFYTVGDVWVGTWNVNGCFSEKEIEMWMRKEGESPYSLYVVGLQEMVPLNPLTVLFNIHVKRTQSKWFDAIKRILEEKYSCVAPGISVYL